MDTVVLLKEIEILNHKVSELNGSGQRIKDVIAEQAEDEGLWFIAQTATEAYLQRKLRELHKVIEQEFGGT